MLDKFSRPCCVQMTVSIFFLVYIFWVSRSDLFPKQGQLSGKQQLCIVVLYLENRMLFLLLLFFFNLFFIISFYSYNYYVCTVLVKSLQQKQKSDVQ